MTEYTRSVELISHSPEETLTIGERLGNLLRPGDVVALYGELGTGKTVLVKGIARGMGIQAAVHSPTFTLVHEYRGPVVLYHVDLYRIDEAEVDSLGLDEYIESGGVVAVEWAEKMNLLLPAERVDVHLKKANESARKIVISSRGPRAQTIIEEFTRNAGACL
ncbi:MAG: tRNA (adenosine(37)-N6)-threonylcarbamoyltransferase complex ATPase subunit type 1 TsaE [Armatimonadota bacterium]|nr:tRNA (adenosine(37)-N6)-threonylcarbamoyltransferase complex ATPase subunit type 1 TsaE [Armatimonadota bacterium]